MALISSKPLGTLIRVADSDGGNGAANYEIADINNLVPGGVVLVRKNIYSNSEFGSNINYPNSTLDNLIKTTIYNKMPQQLRDKMMDVTFNLSGSGNITRKMFALTYTMAGFGNNSGVAEGKALQLYTSDASRVKTFNGSADYWWLSSRYNSDYAWNVYTRGLSNYNAPSTPHGVVPAFVIPQSEMLKDSANTDGSYSIKYPGMAFEGYLMKAGAATFPHKYIQISTYQTTPSQRQDLDSYQDSLGNLHRTVVPHDRSKIIFKTMDNLNLTEKQGIQAFFNAAMTNTRERKVSLTYWNDESNAYATGSFYIPDVTYPIKRIEADNIVYDSVEYHLIEY